MTLTVRRFGSVAALALMLGLLSLLSKSEPVAQGQPPCTVTVQPGQSIQSAIDGAKEGAVICLVAGTWQEHLEIKKPLTLRGAGREQTKIVGKEEGKDVIRIESDTEIKVGLEGLMVAEAKSAASGIDIVGKARVAISNSQVSDNEYYGIFLRGTAQATISNSQLSGNGWHGIVLGDSAQATISNSQLSGNGWDGIWLENSAQAEIRGSIIEDNGKDEDCKEKDSFCNGISVWGKSRVKLINSKVLSNADWGVWAALKQCGDYDYFTGQVTFEDMMLEDISGNSTTNNQKGLGNPGNHPWNRPDVPDGQVCLP